VAEAVVDLLEVVEVDDGDAQRGVVALGAGELARECFVEGAAVADAGERILARLARELLGLVAQAGFLLFDLQRAFVHQLREVALVGGEAVQAPAQQQAGAQQGGDGEAPDHQRALPPQGRHVDDDLGAALPPGAARVGGFHPELVVSTPIEI